MLPTRWSLNLLTMPSAAESSRREGDHSAYLLKLWHHNVASLKAHRQELIQSVTDHEVHILCVQETRIARGEEVSIPGYQSFLRSRNRQGGGVGVFVRDGIPARRVVLPELSETLSAKVEVVAVEVYLNRRRQVV